MGEKTKILNRIKKKEKPQGTDILKRHLANRSLLLSLRSYKELVPYYLPTK